MVRGLITSVALSYQRWSPLDRRHPHVAPSPSTPSTASSCPFHPIAKAMVRLLLPSFSTGPLSSHLSCRLTHELNGEGALNHTLLLACKSASNSEWGLGMSQGIALLVILWLGIADLLSSEKTLANLAAHLHVRICLVLSAQPFHWVQWSEIGEAMNKVPVLNSIEVNRGTLSERIKAGHHVPQMMGAELGLWDEPRLPPPIVRKCLRE